MIQTVLSLRRSHRTAKTHGYKYELFERIVDLNEHLQNRQATGLYMLASVLGIRDFKSVVIARSWLINE